MYLVDDKVKIARGDRLALEQTLLVADAADAAAGSLDGHHLLHHLLLVGVEEARELAGVERRVELEEATQRRDSRLRAHVGEEKRDVSLLRLDWGRLDVSCELAWVFVWGRVGGDELGACVAEEFLEGGDALLAVRVVRG